MADGDLGLDEHLPIVPGKDSPAGPATGWTTPLGPTRLTWSGTAQRWHDFSSDGTGTIDQALNRLVRREIATSDLYPEANADRAARLVGAEPGWSAHHAISVGRPARAGRTRSVAGPPPPLHEVGD